MLFIGDMVLYYLNGDTGLDPWPAIVTEVLPDGRLELSLVQKNATVLFPQRNVHHASTPDLKDEIRFRYGVYETRGEYAAKEEERRLAKERKAALASEHASKIADDNEKAFRVMKQFDEGKKPTEIARSLKIKTEQVNRIIEERTQPIMGETELA